MQLSKIPLSQAQAFTNFFLDYIHRNEKLKSFYRRYPDTDNFKDQIHEKQKSFAADKRELLSKIIQGQYKNTPVKPAAHANIRRLSDNRTFTVVTGHQLNVCTGPLYFIYKIVTVINTCKRLKELYPEFDFVPMYWMASEDHDYDEIKSFRLRGKKYTWVTNQHGAVGRFSTQGLPALIDTLPGEVSIFKNAYQNGNTLSDAVRIYVNELFGDYGLISIDADDAQLKSYFKPVIKDDLFHHTAKKLVDKTSQLMDEWGYKAQVHSREINLFYLDNQLRGRIEQRDDCFYVVETKLEFDHQTILDAIENSPEKFSPNVILRPLFQEMILPNLAYTGGPAEIVYWLQLKSVFEHYGVPFPILLPRNFALIVEHHVGKKLEKTGLAIADFFQDKNMLFKQWVLDHAKNDLSVKREYEAVDSAFGDLIVRSEHIDKTLGVHVAAERKRALNRIQIIEQKMIRAEKRIHREKLGQIEAVIDQLFPNGVLQERSDNFLNFYQSDPLFIQNLLDLLDPFDFRFNVFTHSS
jgi:bacillithiol synthase